MALMRSAPHKQMMNYRQPTNKNESGGIILGERRGKHVIIEFITVPQKGDIKRRQFFHRRDPQHVVHAKALIKNNPTISYLGEWHTHPQRIPKPSMLDISQWNKIQRSRREPLVFIIVGMSAIYVRYGHTHLPRTEISMNNEEIVCTNTFPLA